MMAPFLSQQGDATMNHQLTDYQTDDVRVVMVTGDFGNLHYSTNLALITTQQVTWRSIGYVYGMLAFLLVLAIAPETFFPHQ